MAPTSFSNPSLIGQRIYFGQLQRPSSNTQNNTTFKQPLTRSTGQGFNRMNLIFLPY
ncbi:hypothetical protein DAPPUDRAFT_254541 [Daphnia pulex]|uniref:Uncharacterized protein n=1 Tax=Daphnia pulex TaxID=6669 RepID=E9H7A3_DAPPU|nr:hypothetical protein DAPPUDRAFT_254541 [Daphnia pulex]|eukprot:EFX72343.1 hypothetical protein DAPPUDRAFT_254541 [Daphnia pulex]